PAVIGVRLRRSVRGLHPVYGPAPARASRRSDSRDPGAEGERRREGEKTGRFGFSPPLLVSPSPPLHQGRGYFGRVAGLSVACFSASASSFAFSGWSAATFFVSPKSSARLYSSGPAFFLAVSLGISFHGPLRTASAP